MLVVVVAVARGQTKEPVFTVVTDFDDDSVAAAITEVRNVPFADCMAGRVELRQRGPGSLAVEIGATTAGVSATCDLLLRVPVRFPQADRVAAFARYKGSPVRMAFRVRDANNRVFETVMQPVDKQHEWQPVSAPLTDKDLRPIGEAGKPAWPIQIQGVRVETDQIGKQNLYLDDLHVEHQVARTETIRADFAFSEPTRIFDPGRTIAARLTLENRSRKSAATLNVHIGWHRADGTLVRTDEKLGLTLPASRGEFRSRQEIDFAGQIAEPGLYRLVATVRSSGWLSPARFETTIAVTPSNRNLPRGREMFFGVHADLLRESPADALLEIALARDLGVQLLSIETPWRRVQPTADRLMTAALDVLVEAAAARDIAVQITLVDPPEWVLGSADPALKQAELIAALARRYSDRVRNFGATREALGADVSAGMAQITTGAIAAHPDVRVMIQDAAVGDANAGKLAPIESTSPALRRIFDTAGSQLAAVHSFDRLTKETSRTWAASDRWRHRLGATIDAGRLSDAEDMLRYCVAGAAKGVGGVTWIELRDNDNDASALGSLSGMVTRDFSPKNSLLGFASAVGMLNGLNYVGPVAGTPAEYESAMFIGADRQVAVLVPKPNRIPESVLAPVAGVKGVMESFDFQRIRRPVGGTQQTPLVESMTRPQFITLWLANAEPEAQISLKPPWIRVPARVHVGGEAEFTIEITPPFDVSGGYVRLTLPDGSPVAASLRARQLTAKAEEVVRIPVKMTAAAGADFESAMALLQVSLDGRNVAGEATLEIRREHVVARSAGAELSDAHRIAALRGPDGASADVSVLAGHGDGRLRLRFMVRDDKRVAFKPGVGDVATGDEFWIGLGALNGDVVLQARVPLLGENAAVLPLFGCDAGLLKDWRGTVRDGADGMRVVDVEIPAASLGLAGFAADARLLWAATYWDDDGGGGATGTRAGHSLGSGLDGRRTTDGFVMMKMSRD